jgi:serine protease Do
MAKPRPINRVKRVPEDLLAHGAVRQPWIGVKLRTARSSNPRDALREGAVVGAVVPGSPAARAGIQPGDVLVHAGNRELRNHYDWDALLLDRRVGEDVPVTVRRGGREFGVTVRVADLPEVTAEKVAVLRELELVTLTPALRAERGVRSPRGAVVYRVSDRVSDQLGIAPGDVILQINRTPVDGAETAARALEYYGGRGPIRMYLERAGQVYATDFLIR